MSVCLRIQYARKLFIPTQKTRSVLLKAEFDINGTNSLRTGRCVLFPLLHAAKSNAAFTLSARLWYSLGTNMNTLFCQVRYVVLGPRLKVINLNILPESSRNELKYSLKIAFVFLSIILKFQVPDINFCLEFEKRRPFSMVLGPRLR